MAKYKIAWLPGEGDCLERQGGFKFAVLVVLYLCIFSMQFVSCNKGPMGASNPDTHKVTADGSIVFSSYTFESYGFDQTLEASTPYYPTTLAYPPKWPAWLTLPSEVFIAGEQKKIQTGITNSPESSFNALKVSGVVQLKPIELKGWFKEKASANGFKFVEREPIEWIEDVHTSQNYWLTKSGSQRTIVITVDYGKRWGSFVHFYVDVWLLDEKAK